MVTHAGCDLLSSDMKTLLGLALVVLPALAVADPPAPAEPPAPAPVAPSDPFTRRAVITADSDLRTGPDEGAPSRGKVAAGAVVAAVPEAVHGFRRVRLATGESGLVVDSAVKLEEGEPPQAVARDATAAGAANGFTAAPPPAVNTNTFAVRVGVAMPRSDEISGFDNGLAIAGVFAGRGSEHIGYDVMIGMYQFSYPGTSTVLRTIPVLGAVRFMGNSGNMTAYGLAGGGVGLVTASGTASASATPFLLQLGGGLNLPLTAKTRMEIELRYLMGNAKLFESNVGIDSMLLMAGVSFQ